MMELISLLAQTTSPVDPSAPAPVPGPAAPWWAQMLANPLFMMILGLGLLYFFVFRAKKKEDQKRQALLDAVKRGDQIETIGGLIGTVVNADDKTVVLKVDETANVKMKFNRRAIHRVIVEEKAAAK